MQSIKRATLATLAAALVLLAGCASTSTSTTTPAVPTPPQVTVLNYANLSQAAGDTAARVLVALCTPNPPAISLVTCNKVKTDLLTIKSAQDQIVAQAMQVPANGSCTGVTTPCQLWASARVNIAAIGATAIITEATGNTQLDGDVAAIVAEIKQILGVQ